MSRKRGVAYGLAAMLIAAGAVFLVKWPAGNCTWRSDGSMDPINFWIDCDSVLGESFKTTIHSSSNFEFNARLEPQPPYRFAILAMLLAGGAAFAVAYGGYVGLRVWREEREYP